MQNNIPKQYNNESIPINLPFYYLYFYYIYYLNNPINLIFVNRPIFLLHINLHNLN